MAIDQRSLIVDLFDVKALKFGSFKLKSGELSKYYLDLRVIVSYPRLLKQICSLISNVILEADSSKKQVRLCGVPYTALPIATGVSLDINLPMLIRRKEQKTYGTKKLIDGEYSCGDSVIVIEDVITSGESILETVVDLEKSDLNVEYVIVLVDRQQGGVQRLNRRGLAIKSLFNITQIVTILKEEAKISKEEYQDVIDYIENNQIKQVVDRIEKPLRTKMEFKDRAELPETSKIAQKIFKITLEKKSNLCVAVDVDTADQLLDITEKVGPYICILKTHIDAISGVTEATVNSLKLMAKQYNFLIMEDRKMADIGNTVKLQYSKIVKWADLVTVHSISGGMMLKGIQEVINENKDLLDSRGVFIIAELSCNGNLISQQYVKETVKISEEYKDIVAGLVCQSDDVISLPSLIQLTPGVNMKNSNDALGQKYQNPSDVILTKGADIAVVGRGIILDENPAEAAKLYKEWLWNTYLERVSNS